MNFLAHVFLARHDDEAMLGALLGDFVGTATLHHYSTTMQREILLHRRVDSYTDAHPDVFAARALFPRPNWSSASMRNSARFPAMAGA